MSGGFGLGDGSNDLAGLRGLADSNGLVAVVILGWEITAIYG